MGGEAKGVFMDQVHYCETLFLWKSHGQNMFNATVKLCLMFITWLSHSGIHSSCTYLTKNYKDEINYNLRIDELDDLQITPYEGVIDMSQFMGE